MQSSRRSGKRALGHAPAAAPVYGAAMAYVAIDNPYTLDEAARRPLACEDTLDNVLARAAAEATRLAATSIQQRATLCQRAVEIMQQRRDRIAAEITCMMGKPRAQAAAEVDGMAARARHMIAIAPEALAEQRVAGRDGYDRRIQRVPLGVVLNMPAWNYPLLTCVNALIPALLAGNAVVLKHSTRSLLCGEHFADAFTAAGAAPGVVQAVCCDHARAAWMVADRRVGYVAFTGSVAGGRAIYRTVGRSRFIDVGLELGGKDAAYVAPDADIDQAAAALVDGACYNAGQSCCGVERVYVAASRFDDFVAAARKHMRALRLGDPQQDVYLGPMAQPHAPQQLKRQVDAARHAGAQVLEGGSPSQHHGKGRFFQPSLLVDVHPGMSIMREESFGPLLPVMSVPDDHAAVTHINDSHLGLTASLWTQDVARAHHLAAQLSVGTVYLNQCDTLDPALPWTGVKDSGKGCTLSPLGYMYLTRARALNFRLP